MAEGTDVTWERLEGQGQQRVTVCLQWEGEYYGLWYEPHDERQPLTPRISPPPKLGVKRDLIPTWAAVRLKPVFIGAVDDWPPLLPHVTAESRCMLQPTGSAELGPHAVMFCGQVVAIDRWSDAGGGWTATAVVDCGLPVLVEQRYRITRDSAAPDPNNWMREGAWVAGVARLYTEPLVSGLYQPVAGRVVGMEVLDLNWQSPSFGSVIPMDFGTVLPVDPMTVQQDSVFMLLDAEYVGSLVYRVFPGRPSDCPEPSYPGMLRIVPQSGVRIRKLP